MRSSALSRRDFLTTTAGMAALGLAGRSSPADEPKGSPNEAITLGFIGVGGMGTGLLNIFKGFGDVRVAAVCDVDEAHARRAKEAAGGRPEIVADFRKVLDRKDIDAVVIATPDHWHAIPAILACQAGKDVYCEKPLGYAIGESRRMADAAKKYERVTQMGNLIHASETYHRMVEIVRSGVLGKISKVRIWMNSSFGDLGSPPDGPPPAGVDYDTWLGPAPERAFNPNRFHFRWRYFWDYGGGWLSDFVAHLLDPVHWAFEAEAPSAIAGLGGRYASEDNTETPDTFEVVFQYAKPAFELVWSHQTGGQHGFFDRGAGVAFYGSRGTLHGHYNDYKILPAKGEEIVEPEKTLTRSVGHHREWLGAIKSRGATSCNFPYGHRLSSVGHLGNIALRTGQTLKWDGAAERFTNSDEANRYLLRESYRAPWSLPEV
jgi:predicted dehydrogenase